MHGKGASMPNMSAAPPHASPSLFTGDDGKSFHKILDDKLGDALLTIWAAYQRETSQLRQEIAYLNKQVLVYSNERQYKKDRELEILQDENMHLKNQLAAAQQRWPDISSSEAIVSTKLTQDVAVLTDPIHFEGFDYQFSACTTRRDDADDQKTSPPQRSVSEKSSPSRPSPTSPRSGRGPTTPRNRASLGIMPISGSASPIDSSPSGRSLRSGHVVKSRTQITQFTREDSGEHIHKRREQEMEVADSKSLEKREDYVRKTLRANSKNLDESHISRLMDFEHDGAAGAAKVLLGALASLLDWWYALDEPPRSNILAKFLKSSAFSMISNMAIVISFFFVGFVANYRVKHYEYEDDGPIVYYGETMQYGYFTGEVILKLIVHKTWFFCNENMGWNMFDFALAFFGAYDRYDNQYSDKVAFMRCVRLLKLAGTFLDSWFMRWTPELRVLIGRIMGSFSAIIWSSCLLASVYYAFGAVFAQGAATYLHQKNKDNEVSDVTLEILDKLSTVSACMMRLLEASTGGDDWGNVYPLIRATGKINATLFIAFIAFIQILIFNLLTGLFVEATIKGAQPDRQAKALALRKEDLIAEAELLRIMKEIDKDGDKYIRLDEFSNYLRSEKFRSYLKLNGLDMTERDAKMIYMKVKDLLSIEDGDVPTEAFLLECLKLKGDAKTLDLWRCIYMQQQIHSDIMERLDVLEGLTFDTHEVEKTPEVERTPQQIDTVDLHI